jgi:hypothetical protein
MIWPKSITRMDGAMEFSPFEQVRLTEFVQWYPAIEQERMMTAWLADNSFGSWTHSGYLSADDRTVITPNPDVNYGYCWFNVSNGPIVIELPHYRRYSSLSVFDMMHFVPAVIVGATTPIVIRLASQPSPIVDAHDVVIETVCGLAFLRMVIPEPSDEAEVLALAAQIRTTGGDGDLPFIVPDFTETEYAAGLDIIKQYSMPLTSSLKVFGTREQGLGDMDRCAGVFLGQLGIPADYIQYTQYVQLDGEPLGGDGSYTVTVGADPVAHDDGYWSVTVYNMEDRYLIPNPHQRYSISSYNAEPNADGTCTIRINPDGAGANAIPTMGKPIYAIMRAYQPIGVVEFPPIEAT